jgi:serine/threonine protein kinase
LTSTGEIASTSDYLAPERAKGRPGDPKAEYALGCVLYHLVTGHPPFYGDTPVAVAYQHVDTDPVPPGELRPALAGKRHGIGDELHPPRHSGNWLVGRPPCGAEPSRAGGSGFFDVQERLHVRSSVSVGWSLSVR